MKNTKKFLSEFKKKKKIATAVLFLITAACSHIPITKDRDPELLLNEVCKQGADVQEVRGSVWLKAKSLEASGQFPATVVAKAPDQLQLEVTNLLGGTEATIKISGNQFSIDIPHKKSRPAQETGSWGGIPLRWALDLFLGRIPCPKTSQIKPKLLTHSEKDELSVETLDEKFIYHFKNWGNSPWVDSLRWEKSGSVPMKVEFHFESPLDAQGGTDSSAGKWEAKSTRGEVRVRWKDRTAIPR